MKAERLITEPFEFVQMNQCEIKKEAGEHGHAVISGYISADNEKGYLQMACDQTEVKIFAIGETGERRQIYCGILEDMKIMHENSLCLMEIRIVPYTYLLDLKPQRRSFQIPAMAYQEVLDCIAKSYAGGNILMNIGTGEAIGEPIVQYQETDWAFIKRLASHFHAVVVPSYATSGAKMYFGLAEWSGGAKMFPSSYQVHKEISTLLYKEQNQVQGLIEDDSLVYVAEDQELYEIGQMVELNGRMLYVERAESRLDGHQLWNTYYLKTKAGFQVPRQYNEKMIGASLDGTVTEVRGDVVRVSLRTDAKSGAGKWFSFSTVYSSPDGSGWYCMPEPGDEIRLYFPTEQEKHGYVISAVHLPVTQPQAGAAVAAADIQNPASGQAAFGKQGEAKKNPGARRSDPTHKTICTSSNKMVDLSEHSIILDAGNGMSVVLDDEYGISIVSPKGVYIQSDACIDISSLNDRVEISGATSVNIAQEDSSIEVKESNVIYHGANARVQ